MPQQHHRRHGRAHPPERYGALDVPLTVWTVSDVADLTAHLFAELKPARGPIMAVSLPGWASICRAGRRALVFGADRGAFARAQATLPASKQGLAIFQAIDYESAAVRMAKLHGSCALALCSAEVLTWPGAMAALVGAMRPGGLVVLLGRTDIEAAELSDFSRPSRRGRSEASAAALGLEFIGYLVAAPKRVFDASVAAAVHRERRPLRPSEPLTRHFDIAVWRKRPATSDGDLERN
ncbi:hypothetical protein [Glycomyces xiaoerkulensis]|uniref:hypothetical protein n=1 Tax=Glycomyces xiaoerkulensis TaxID=2038139 RepID=UPI0013000F71|nr:hypothetical protein [Glycomyces xiaoerkulensis]